MENVRAKLEEFTEHIETADEQVLTHKNDTLEAIARYEKLEVTLLYFFYRQLFISNNRFAKICKYLKYPQPKYKNEVKRPTD